VIEHFRYRVADKLLLFLLTQDRIECFKSRRKGMFEMRNAQSIASKVYRLRNVGLRIIRRRTMRNTRPLNNVRKRMSLKSSSEERRRKM